MELKESERVDDLQLDGLKIIQDKNKYCFTSDSAILANFVDAKKSDIVCEVGTGTGVISILVEHKCCPKKIYAFEIQEQTANLAKRNVLLNNMQNSIEIINAPIQKFNDYFSCGTFDVVFSNPPYIKVFENSQKSVSKEEAISKHEIELKLDELLSVSSKILKFGGKFYVVYDAKRSAELIFKLKQNNLEPKKIFFTSPSLNSKPVLIVVQATKGGKEGVEVLPTLITNDKDGSYIYTIQKLYRREK